VNANTPQLDELLQTARRATRENEYATVIAACEEARKSAPDDTRFVFMQGAALRRAGDPEAAVALLQRTVEAAPKLGPARQELGLALLSLGRVREARETLEQAVAVQSDLKPAWRALYDVRAAEGDDAGAADAYRRALGASEPDPVLKKAIDLFSAGRLGVAEGICREYLRQRPMDVDAIRLLADIGIKLGVVDEAILLLERCLELAPDFHIARSNYATALGRQQRFDEALAQLERLLEVQPQSLAHRVNRASVLSMAGRFDAAHAEFRDVLKVAPDSAPILTNYGHSLRYGGKGAEATEVYLKAIVADPTAGEAWFSLANLKTFRFSDEQIEAMRARLAALAKPGPDRFHLAFALGKALEDSESWDESFAAYAIGNDIKCRTSGYDRNGMTARVDAAIDACGPELFDGRGHASDEPIFIVGLPRAGSTLLEQILASHSTVEATSELPFIGQIARDLSAKRKKTDAGSYPAVLRELSGDRREELGQLYLDRAAIYRTGAPRFIDKLPNNFMHIALIRTILPKATIVDARREPMAACFANFKQLFAQGQEFTYSLEDIGNYYADYLRLMDHWHSILPGGVLTVHYEDVVADLETQVRALLAFCKLDFEEACLRFHEQERAVRTASSEQVRQPIYKDALALWKNYESHLEPLRQVLLERGVIDR